MHRKALIAIAVGSILGGAAYAAGEQSAPTSSPDSQAPPAGVTGVNGHSVTPGNSSSQSTTAADKQIARDQRDIAHDQSAIRDYQKDVRYDQAKIGQNQAEIRADEQNIRAEEHAGALVPGQLEGVELVIRVGADEFL